MSGIPAGAGQLLGKRLGKFEILALLALGGTAEIYLARIGGAAGFEKYVVVKCLHDHLADDGEFVKMFLDEARLAAHLDHSNIVQTMELGQHDGRYYMVMEFLAGLSLAMIVRRAAERLPDARIPVPLVLNILAQSCAGLHYAHEKAMNGKPLNIVHRDISPQNLVISFEGVVKVVDFGIAKAELRETRTRSGTIKGKFAYMSPEQCVANNVDRRTDVFALGVIGHELLTGRRLFKRPSPYETYQAVMECDVKPPSLIDASIDPALDAVLMRALTKDKDVRYPTAEAFGDALLGYLHHRGIGSGPGDVSRFFDAYFGQELDEHSGRMRELISGRDISVDTGVNWGGDDAEDDARREALGGAGRDGSLVRESGDIEELRRPGVGSAQSQTIDGDLSESRVEDDDEMPAERTRIETNPLERINELDLLAAKAQPKPPSKSALLPTAPAPSLAPSPPPVAPSVAPSRSPVAPSRSRVTPSRPPAAPNPPPAAPSPPPAVGAPLSPASWSAEMPPPVSWSAEMPSSGRFPDLANLPTMISAGEALQPDADSFAPAPTEIVPVPPASSFPPAAPPRMPPPAAGAFASAPTNLVPPPPANAFANAPTDLVQPPPNAFANAPTSLAPRLPPSAFANAPTNVAVPLIPMVDPGPPPVRPSGSAFDNAPTNIAPSPLGGYPVMNAQLSAQIATGASVFPSGPSGASARTPSRGTEPTNPSSHHSAAHVLGSGPISDPGGAFDSSGMPVSGAFGLHGSNGYAEQRNDSGGYQPSSDGLSDVQRAANLMSPVGQSYPQKIDWAAAAATRARAVPPWLLGLLFVAAIGIALALTIVLARAIR